MSVLNENQVKLLSGNVFAHVATLGPDGAPQVTPVWVEWDGTHVVFNTEQKRAKLRNLARDPRVAISILSADSAYSYVEIRGKVVETTTDGAAEQLDRLCKRYTGQEKYPWHKPGDVRVVVKVLPEKVLGI